MRRRRKWANRPAGVAAWRDPGLGGMDTGGNSGSQREAAQIGKSTTFARLCNSTHVFSGYSTLGSRVYIQPLILSMKLEELWSFLVA